MRERLAIVGGGIGGMTAALALHRAGIDFTLYERAPAFTEVGAGVSLWPNATRVLKSLGVLDAVASLGERVTRFDLRRPDGRLISGISLGKYQSPALCIHRADLHRCLRDPLPSARLEANRRLLAFTPDAGGVTATFAGGLEIAAAGLIGADGINSVIRSQLHGAAAPVYRGYCVWRGIAPEMPGIGRGHISETWGSGRRFGIMPLGHGRICWYATRNSPPSQPDAPEGRKHEVLQLFRNWHQPITELIEATEPSDIIKTDARDRDPLRRWGQGRVTLLGDAAHPITPNVGQGACLAIEDAACIAQCLLASPDAAAAFQRYEAARKGRTASISRQSRRIGGIAQWQNRWIVPARNAIAGLVLACASERRLNAVYNHEV